MVQYQAELRKARQTAEREARISELMAEMNLNHDVFGLFALFFSQSDKYEIYSVSINEETMTAESCTCPGCAKGHHYCVHCEAVDRYFTAEQVAAESERENEKKMNDHRLDESYKLLAQAQREWAEHWSPLLNVSVEALLSMGCGEYRPLIEQYEEERNRYNRVALALGW